MEINITKTYKRNHVLEELMLVLYTNPKVRRYKSAAARNWHIYLYLKLLCDTVYQVENLGISGMVYQTKS